MPTASAARITRLRSRSAVAPPVNTVTAVLSRVIRAERRDGSRLGGVSTVTPSALVSTMTTSSPTATSTILANAPPSTTPALPDAVWPSMVTSPWRATAPVSEPSPRPGRSLAQVASSPMAANAALAITVGTNGPGATRRPSSSTTTTNSSRPNPEPPWASGRCSPSQPRPAISFHTAGMASSSASSSAWLASNSPRLRARSATVSPSARWSSVMAMAMGGVLLVMEVATNEARPYSRVAVLCDVSRFRCSQPVPLLTTGSVASRIAEREAGARRVGISTTWGVDVPTGMGKGRYRYRTCGSGHVWLRHVGSPGPGAADTALCPRLVGGRRRRAGGDHLRPRHGHGHPLHASRRGRCPDGRTGRRLQPGDLRFGVHPQPLHTGRMWS